MDQIHIQIIQLQLIQSVLECCQDVRFIAVTVVPQFGSDEQLLACANSGLDALAEGLADFALIGIGMRAVNVAIASLNGSADRILDMTGFALPRS